MGLRKEKETKQAKMQHEEEGISFPSVFFMTGTKPILTSFQNIFWSAASSFLGRKMLTFLSGDHVQLKWKEQGH